MTKTPIFEVKIWRADETGLAVDWDGGVVLLRTPDESLAREVFNSMKQTIAYYQRSGAVQLNMFDGHEARLGFFEYHIEPEHCTVCGGPGFFTSENGSQKTLCEACGGTGKRK